MAAYRIRLVDVNDSSGKTIHSGEYSGSTSYEAISFARTEFARELKLTGNILDIRLRLKVLDCNEVK